MTSLILFLMTYRWHFSIRISKLNQFLRGIECTCTVRLSTVVHGCTHVVRKTCRFLYICPQTCVRMVRTYALKACAAHCARAAALHVLFNNKKFKTRGRSMALHAWRDRSDRWQSCIGGAVHACGMAFVRSQTWWCVTCGSNAVQVCGRGDGTRGARWQHDREMLVMMAAMRRSGGMRCGPPRCCTLHAQMLPLVSL